MRGGAQKDSKRDPDLFLHDLQELSYSMVRPLGGLLGLYCHEEVSKPLATLLGLKEQEKLGRKLTDEGVCTEVRPVCPAVRAVVQAAVH